MNQNLISLFVSNNKLKTKPAVGILYPAKNNYLTEGERIESLEYYCGKQNLKLMQIYDVTENEFKNMLLHQSKFFKMLQRIEEGYYTDLPVVLLFESIEDINYIDDFWELMDRIDEMVRLGIVEVHAAKERFIFSKSVKHSYDLSSNSLLHK